MIKVTVSLHDILGSKPGDPCPAVGCEGHYRELSLSWSTEGIHCEATCDTCVQTYCLVDAPGYASQEIDCVSSNKPPEEEDTKP